MFGVQLSVTRPAGRALLIGNESCRQESLQLLHRLKFQCGLVEDPYAAMIELARQPHAYGAVVISLNSFYREELQFIAAIKQVWPQVEVWLTLTDGRAAALAEAMRLGADGLLNEEGWHRTAAAPAPIAATSVSPISSPRRSTSMNGPMSAESRGVASADASESHVDSYPDDSTGEPVLSAAELRALLQEPPTAIHAENEQ